MATFQTYQAIGIREDLTDVITNISPVDNWFQSNTGNGKATATYHEWQTDALAAAAANKHVEGAAFSDGTVTPTVRIGNYTQILKKEFKISKTQDAVNTAGRKREMAYQTEKHAKELSNDLEYAFLINSAAAAGDASTARQMKGVAGFITTNSTDASAATLDEDTLLDELQNVWAAGGKPTNVVCGAFQKRTMSAFTTNTRYTMAEEEKLTQSVDVYQSDFGNVMIRLHHIVNTAVPDDLYIFGDMGLFTKAFLRPINRKPEPFAGDADLYSMVAEVTLECKQEKGHGMITNLATSA